jgi:hypothetical protein
MGGMKSLLFRTYLPAATEDAFEKLVDHSLADAYFGPCEPHRGPVDAERARKLAFEMWSDLLHENAIWSACARFLDLHAS